MPLLADTLSQAATEAAQPVTVPWRPALVGFAAGFAVAFLPSLLVAALLLPGARMTVVTAFFLAVVLGVAAAVGMTAHARRP